MGSSPVPAAEPISHGRFGTALCELEKVAEKFAPTINIILVAFHVRDAALPCPATDQEWLARFVSFFNNATVPLYLFQASAVLLLRFTLKRGYDGEIVTDDLIIRGSNIKSYNTDFDWSDEQLGRYLGMDDVNTNNFGNDVSHAFEAVEIHTGVAIFHELIARSFMTSKKYEEFCYRCCKTVQRWNEVMAESEISL